MSVAHATKVGGWRVFHGRCYRADSDPGWYVEHQLSPYASTVWGPFPSKEDAIRESGMPKPKTELEEVWEVAKELHDIARRAVDRLSRHENLYFGAIHARDRFDNLSKKYGKA